MGDLQEPEYTAAEKDDAMKEVAIALPKPKDATPKAHVDPTRVPSVEDVLHPERPEMSGASRDDVVDSIADTVNVLYDKVFEAHLTLLQGELAKSPPPPETPWAAKLLGMAADKIVDAALVAVGGYAAKFAGEAVGELATSAVEKGAEKGGKAAGGWIGKKVEEAATPEPVRMMPAESLLAEFIERTRLGLYARQHDVKNQLRLIRRSAARNHGDLEQLDSDLSNLARSEQLIYWFHSKVTMEWMNFCARLELGPRTDGQLTDMKHANTIGGFDENPREATGVWRGEHKGFIDITVSTDHAANIRFVRAFLEGGPGVLKNIKQATSFSLATLPVYRRIWIKTGQSALDSNPAFVITPEGAIEANVDDQVLQGVGAGAVTLDDSTLVGYQAYSAEDRANTVTTVMRRANAASAMSGARKIIQLLAAQNPAVIQ